jgi:hypothetical protein
MIAGEVSKRMEERGEVGGESEERGEERGGEVKGVEVGLGMKSVNKRWNSRVEW